MIVWIASYPRSGNTLTRMILKYVFGYETYSKYNDPYDIGADEKTMELVGHRMLDYPWSEAYQRMKQSDKIYFVKTHDIEDDGSKTIYIVRDGRSAIVSYWHYLKDYRKKELSLSDIISGFVPFGSWGGHLDEWNPLKRSDTLLIQFESLVNNPVKEIRRIKEFTGLKITGTWKNDFEYFHKINPYFFRAGHIEDGNDEINGDDLDLFCALHGDWMETFNYRLNERRISNISLLRKRFHQVYKTLCSLEVRYTTIDTEKNKLTAEIARLLDLNSKIKTEREVLKGKVEMLTKEIVAEMKTQLSQIQNIVQQRDRELSELSEKYRQLQDVISEHRKIKSQMEIRIKTIEEEKDKLTRENNKVVAERDALLNSLSWRLTKPARLAFKFIRGK